MKQIHSIATFLFCCLTATFAAAESPIQPGNRIAIVGNTFADQLRIHGYLETLLLRHTFDNPVSIRNLGWGGDMLTARDRPTGFPTEESMLTEHKTDVIIACFGMGESFAGEEGLKDFGRHVKAFLTSHAGRKYNGKSDVRLILVSPIACEDLGKLTPARNKRNRDLQAYTRAMQEVATGADVPFVDLFEASRYLMDEPTGPKLTNNGIHLNPYGYWAISHAFYDQLTASDRVPNGQSWLLRIDATTRSNDARGVEISELTRDESGLSFQVTEQSAPRLRPPTDQPLPPQLEFVRDTLIIANLKPGEYRLTIDEKPVATATATAWAEGVAVDTSPLHKEAEAYRAVVNDKNLQFTYSWKALNQVHIVGERQSSPSGRELPKEVIEFNRLANDLDKALNKRIGLRTRQWRVVRAGS
ncbi:MAG: SGNH/GDSL hydrolase family protein [Fuerstiella sp.]|nr:SGNH/GDSL hydrolase family protein [Fuerstiella sp.]MCP4854863.1 SGNH/GDSL hydrolase family protein [Fuerstiella sp.]